MNNLFAGYDSSLSEELKWGAFMLFWLFVILSPFVYLFIATYKNYKTIKNNQKKKSKTLKNTKPLINLAIVLVVLGLSFLIHFTFTVDPPSSAAYGVNENNYLELQIGFSLIFIGLFLGAIVNWLIHKKILFFLVLLFILFLSINFGLFDL